MKKFFAITFLLTAIFIGTACAEEESSSPAAAPKEINHPHSIYYKHPDFYNMTSTDSRIILTHYPTYQQTTEFSCGPAAALTVLNYYGNRDFDEATLIKRMDSKPEIGTSLANMVKFFKELDWDVQSNLDTPPMDEFEFQKFVMKNLSEGKPIIVENVEWGGHWRVIIGYDALSTPADLYDDVLIFADSYDTSDHDQDGYTIGSFDRFFWMWFDKHERPQAWLIVAPRRL
ncbi:MAG: C39 family peptidase [Selenomonadaceae bacterium]|nr:C39 family peptidase [Selenomonadaceae bacterium]